MNELFSPSELQQVTTEPHRAAHSAADTVESPRANVPKGQALVTVPQERPYDDFDWSSDDTVLIREQTATAVYLNPAGDLVIRQRANWPDEDSDPYMVITAENVDAFVDRIADLIGIPSAGRRS